MVLIMITGDFLGMALTTYNVRPSPAPNTWRIGNLTVAGVTMGLGSWFFARPFSRSALIGWGSKLAR